MMKESCNGIDLALLHCIKEIVIRSSVSRMLTLRPPMKQRLPKSLPCLRSSSSCAIGRRALVATRDFVTTRQ
jgi:hypothetical protein